MRIAGLVVDHEKHPIAGATVTLQRGDRPVQATTQTDARGEFSFQVDGDDEDRSRVVASLDGLSSCTEYHHDDQPGAAALLLALWPAVTVSGTVMDTTGKPLAEVAVRTVHHETRTDANGRYCLAGLPRGQHYVNAWRNGLQMRLVELDAASDTTLDLRLEPASGRTIRFRVNSNQPQEATQWFVFSYVPWCLNIKGTLDETGEHTLAGLPTDIPLQGGAWRKDMQANPIGHYLDAHARPGPVEWVTDLSPKQIQRVSGIVFGADSRPVPGHKVKLLSSFDVDHRTVADDSGRFEFTAQIPDGETFVLSLQNGPRVVDDVDSEAWFNPRCRNELRRTVPTSSGIVVRTAPAAGIAGRCVTSDNRPLSGAIVTLYVRWTSPAGLTTSKVAATDSDADGRFMFTGLNARIGEGVFVEVKKHLLAGVSAPLSLVAGSVIEPPPIVAEQLGSARGSLRLASGAPAAATDVCVGLVDGTWGDRGRGTAESGADGRFEVRGLRRGTYALWRGWYPGEGEPLTAPFEVPLGQEADIGVITIES